MCSLPPLRSRILALAFSLYLTVGGVAALYFNWTYARDNGFVKWLFLGQIVPTAKATIWPYFIVRSRNPSPSTRLPRSVQNFFYATDALVRANERPEGIQRDSNVVRVRAILSEAADSGHGIDRDDLNRIYSGLGDHFLDDAIVSARLYVEAIDSRDGALVMRGTAANLRWQTWWNANGNDVMNAMATRFRVELK